MGHLAKISIIWGVWSKTPKKHVYLGVEIRVFLRIWTPEIVKKVTISDPPKIGTLVPKYRRNQLADKDLEPLRDRVAMYAIGCDKNFLLYLSISRRSFFCLVF